MRTSSIALLVALSGCASQLACRYEAIGVGPQNTVILLDKSTGDLFVQNMPKVPTPQVPEHQPEI